MSASEAAALAPSAVRTTQADCVEGLPDTKDVSVGNSNPEIIPFITDSVPVPPSSAKSSVVTAPRNVFYNLVVITEAMLDKGLICGGNINSVKFDQIFCAKTKRNVELLLIEKDYVSNYGCCLHFGKPI